MVSRIIDDESEAQPEDREPIYYGNLKLKDKEKGFCQVVARTTNRLAQEEPCYLSGRDWKPALMRNA